MADSYQNIFTNINKVMCIMPHPDDTEIYAGGTISRLVNDQIEVQVIKITLGEKGCRTENISPNELKVIRKQEDILSMQKLGIKPENNIYLDLGDGEIEENIKNIGIIAERIRLFQPDLIITTNPEDMIIRFDKKNSWINHRDHINTGKIALYASYPYARDLSFFPEHFANSNAKSHICTRFLITDTYNHPDNVFIDISKYQKNRTEAIASHSSQYSQEDAEDSTEFFTSNWEAGKNFECFRYLQVD